MAINYDPWLVTLSVVVAVLVSYTTLSVAARLPDAGGRQQLWWIAGGACAAGFGLWAMHFIGMLALRLPIPLGYDIPLTLLSAVPALVGAALLLFVAARASAAGWQLLASGVVIGLAAALMHYTGMAALKMEPPLAYRTLPLLLSLILPIATVSVVLVLIAGRPVGLHLRPAGRAWLALALGAGFAAMHYAGTSAAVLAPGSAALALPRALDERTLAVAVGLTSLLILAVILGTAIFDARLADEEARVRAELEQEVAERTVALREMTRELRRSNEELEHFAYVASHDLKEPLRTIAGFTQLLERRSGTKLDDKDREYIGFVVQGVAQMQRLIDDLLTYSRAGNSNEPPQPVALDAVLDRVLRNLDAALREADAQVTRSELPTVLGRESELEQLLQNLIGNAIKFRSERPPRIEVSARPGEQADQWRIEVADNGIGIAPEHRERIFGIFNRLHGRGDYPGTGVGLAVCRKVVEHLGGRIWVESEPGQGSRFIVLLPAAVSPAADLSDNNALSPVRR